MDPLEQSAPGFAIFRRPRNAVSARHRVIGPAEARSAGERPDYVALMPGSLDAVAEGLKRLEEEVDHGTVTLEPEAADRLRAELARAGAELIDARFADAEPSGETLTALRDTVLALEAELAIARARHATDADEIERLRERTCQLTEQLRQAHQDAARDQRLITSLQEAITSLQFDLDDARGRLDMVRADEVAVLRQQAGDLQLAIHDIRCRLLAQNHETEELRVENDLLKAQISDTEALLRATHSQLKKTREGVAAANKRVALLHAQNSTLKQSNEDLKRENVRLVGEAASQRHENDLMEQWLNGALSRYAELQIRHNDLERSLDGAAVA